MPALASPVTTRNGRGRCSYTIRCYLGDGAEGRRAWVTTHELRPRQFELQFDAQSRRHCTTIPDIRIGTELSFATETDDQQRIPWVPIEESETVFGRVRVPDLDPSWQESPEPPAPGPRRFQILLEATLEGLLADYQGGSHAPSSIEELLELSIAARILRTQIPERLAEMGYSEQHAGLRAGHRTRPPVCALAIHLYPTQPADRGEPRRHWQPAHGSGGGSPGGPQLLNSSARAEARRAG